MGHLSGMNAALIDMCLHGVFSLYTCRFLNRGGGGCVLHQVHGSYQNIEGGDAGDVLSALSGAP